MTTLCESSERQQMNTSALRSDVIADLEIIRRRVKFVVTLGVMEIYLVESAMSEELRKEKKRMQATLHFSP